MKVLYLYAGARKGKFRGTPGVDFADTQFYGQTQLKEFGVDASYLEWSDISRNPLLGRLLGFRLRQLLLYFWTRGSDIVFGSGLLYMMVLKKLLRPTRRFVLLNIGLGRTLAVNKRNPLKHRFLAALLRELDAVVCLARFQKNALEESYPFLRGRVFYVPLGVDTEFYRPVHDGRQKYLLAAGRDDGRDYKTVFEVARLLPEVSFQVVCSRRNLTGAGEAPQNVHVFFDLPPAELYQKYREAAALLLLTHDDNYGDGADCSGQTVLLDAFACGLPVVASRKRYLEDYCTEGKDALVVGCYDAPAAAAAATSLLRDPAYAAALARSARERAEREFSSRAMAEGLARVFKQLGYYAR